MRGTGLNKLVKNISITLSRQLGTSVLSLITIIIITRFYGAEGNGQYVVALILPTTLAMIMNLGISSSNIYYIASKKIDVSCAWSVTLKIFFYIVIVGLLIGFLLLYFGADKFFPGLDTTILFLGLMGFPLILLLSLISGFFQALQDFKSFNLILIMQPALSLLFVVGLWGLKYDSIILLFVFQILSLILTTIVAIVVLYRVKTSKRTITEKNKTSQNYAKKILTYGYKSHISNLLAFINEKADSFIINLFLGPTSVGIYFIALRLADTLSLLSNAVSTIALPRLSELHDQDEIKNYLTPLIARCVLVITFSGALILALVGYLFIDIIFGVEFSTATYALFSILPGVVFSSVSRVLANDIAARGRPEVNMYTSWISVILNVGGNIYMIPKYGIVGAGLSTSFAYFVNFTLRIFMYKNFTGVRKWDVLLIKKADFLLFKEFISKASIQFRATPTGIFNPRKKCD